MLLCIRRSCHSVGIYTCKMDEKDTRSLCARYSLLTGMGRLMVLVDAQRRSCVQGWVLLQLFQGWETKLIFCSILWVLGASETQGLLFIMKKGNCCSQKSRKNMQKFGGGRTEMAIVIVSGSCCIYARKAFALLGDSSEILMFFMLAQSSGKERSYLFSEVVGGWRSNIFTSLRDHFVST